jgi:hypothetical protein
MFFEQYSLLLFLSRPRLWRMWGVEMTAQSYSSLKKGRRAWLPMWPAPTAPS